MPAPLVSVVMLTHNREKYIGEAIESVLHQTFQDIEFIILDDGSSDSTEQIIASFSDPRIRRYRFAPSGQISRLRNFGISNSIGEYIAFIDSDDVWDATKLSIQIECFGRYPNAGFGFCDVTEFKDQKSPLRSGIYKNTSGGDSYSGNIFRPLVQNQYVIYPSTAIFKKTCLANTGLVNETLKPGETEFFTRMAYANECFISFRKLVNIRKHPENSSDQLKLETVHEMQFSLQQLKTQGKISNAIFRKMMAWYYYLGGMAYIENKLYSKACKQFILCVQYRPFRIKAWIRIVMTLIQSLF